MTRTIEVEIDSAGKVSPVDAVSTLPQGRTLQVWQTPSEHEPALLSEAALAVDWLRPEEDDAWAYLQPGR